MPRGGYRPGSGRKKGSKDRKTLEREAVMRSFNQRVMRASGRLFNAQMSKAEGCSLLICKPDKGKSYIVKDETTIQRFIDGELEQGEDGSSGYYYITTQNPDADAADRLLNRAFGKAKETKELSGPDGGPIPISRVEFVDV